MTPLALISKKDNLSKTPTTLGIVKTTIKLRQSNATGGEFALKLRTATLVGGSKI
jgi:hypothetical protein